MKYNIAVIGSREAIIGFKAVGLTPYFCNSADKLIEKLYELKKKTNTPESEEKYGIIFITEDMATMIPDDDWKKLTNTALPAIISIPSHKGATGVGIERLNKIVERALGSNILG